jgi:hypothetical protein
MIVRDIDVLVDAASHARVSVTFSIPTLDHEIWSKTEPATPPPRQRLAALTRLVDAGIEAGVGRRFCPASRIGRSSWPTSCGPRETQARRRSGRTS